MIINRAYKIRLYPTKSQQVFFNKTFGCCRSVYNTLLYERNKFNNDFIKPVKEQYKYDELLKSQIKVKNLYKKNKSKEIKSELDNIKSKINTIKSLLNPIYKQFKESSVKEIKESCIDKDTGKKYMYDTDSQGLSNAQRDLQSAYGNFFKNGYGFPKYRKKSNKQSYRNGMMHTDIKKLIVDNFIIIPKAGYVKFRQDYNFKKLNILKICNITIEKSKKNNYYCSICCEVDQQEWEHTGNCIGLDLGLKDPIITSDGQKFNNPKNYKKYEKKIKRLSKQQSKKQKDSKNKEKLRLKLAAVHEKLCNVRKDNLHKITTYIVKNNDIICMEDLNVKGMVKNHKLATAIQDASFGTIANMLQYKCAWYGRQLIKVDRFYPSSKTCSCCGHVLDNLSLDIREWTCPECGIHHDRDVNAAKNILNEGLNLLDNIGQELPESKPVENPTMDDRLTIVLKSSGSMNQEGPAPSGRD